MIKIKLRRFDTVVELQLPTEWFIVRVNLWQLGLDRDPAKYTLEDLNAVFSYQLPEDTDLAAAYALYRNQTAHGVIQRPEKVDVATYRILRCFVYTMNLKKLTFQQNVSGRL